MSKYYLICSFHLSVHTNASSIQYHSTLKHTVPNICCLNERDEFQNAALGPAGTVLCTPKIVKVILRQQCCVEVSQWKGSFIGW